MGRYISFEWRGSIVEEQSLKRRKESYAIKPIAEQALGSNRTLSCRNGLTRRYAAWRGLRVKIPSWRTAATTGSCLGAMVAAFCMYAAWSHNPQGEFHNESGIEWGPWLLIGASWFIVAFAIVSAFLGALSVTIRIVAARFPNSKDATKNGHIHRVR